MQIYEVKLLNFQEVRVGPSDTALSASVDLDDLCSSPPAPSITPPSSPNVQARESPWEPVELQLDYWQLPKPTEAINKTDKPKQDGKTSLKGLFRGLQVTPTGSSLSVTVHMANKEKKQKSKFILYWSSKTGTFLRVRIHL